MKSIDEFLDHRPKTFHPVKEQNPEDWQPSTEITDLLVQADHIWEDLVNLANLYQSEKSDYTKKLIFKYVVIELRSLIQVVNKLQGFVMKTPVFDPSLKQGWRELTLEEYDQAKIFFQQYKNAKKDSENTIIKIRNEIGAHRGNINWNEVRSFWDSLEPELINPLLESIHSIMNYVRTLDLFDWTRTTSRGTTEITGGVLRPEYFE